MESCDCLDHCGDDRRVAAGTVVKCHRHDQLHHETWQRWTAASLSNCMTTAARDVLQERRRQIEAKGWTPAHDDEHDEGEIPHAAACYALMAGGTFAVDPLWPKGWGELRAKPHRRMLVVAAALLLAEIERVDRLAKLIEKG